MLKNRKLNTLIIFVFSFSFLILIKSNLVVFSKDYLINVNKILLDNWVNDVYLFEKKAEIYSENENFIKLDCIFFNTKNGTIERYALIDVFNEFVLPLILVIATSFSVLYLLRLKFTYVVTTFILSLFIFSNKIIMMVFDNYNYTDYQLTLFSFPMKQIIYYFNKLLNVTGSSLNFVLPVLIVLLAIGIHYKQVNWDL